MWKFWQWLTRRAWPAWSTSQSLDDLSALFGSGTTTTAAGVDVTVETALGFPAVFGCIQVLAQDVARTPIKFRRQTAPDTYVDAVDHDLFEILGTLSNPEMTAYQTKYKLTWDLLAYGRAYAQIMRVDGRVTALWPLSASAMQVDRDTARRKRWTYTAGGQTFVWTFDPSMPPIFEVTMESPITRCRELIGIARAVQTYEAKFFSNGGRLAGILTAPGTISPVSLERLRAAWDAAYSKPENAHKVALLEGGLTFQGLAANNQDSQLAEILTAITQQVCGVFRVPVWKVGDLSKATYSNMEAGELAYVTSTLDPLYQLFEEAIRRDLLTVRQYQQYSVVFDRAALIRSDVKAQHDAIAVGVNTGFYSQNDARRMLGLNPIPDGDQYRVNTALQPVGGTPHVA